MFKLPPPRCRIWVMLCVLALISTLFVFSGCKKRVNIKGATVLIAASSNPYDVNDFEPRNESEELVLEARKKLLADNNLTMRQDVPGDYDTYFQGMVNMILSGNKEYGVYQLEAYNALKLYKQGLLFPISDSDVVLPANHYNKMIENLFTFDGKIYASSHGKTADYWQDGVIFFNKRLFKEAGLEEDILYDLQKAGTWNWETFLDFARRLTRDIDNDGILDIYAIPYENDANSGLLEALIVSNGADFVTLDSTGTFHDGTNSLAFLEAVQFYQTLLNERLIKVPDIVVETNNPGAAAWDWYMSEFIDGRVAMVLAPEWAKTMFGEMKDDYGMVFPPRGPRANGYRIGSSCTLFVVPHLFTKPEVDVILAAYDAWSYPDTGVPEDPEGWKNGHWWAHRDRRAVDETGELQREDANVAYKIWTMVPGYHTPKSRFTAMFFSFEGTPVQWLETFSLEFSALIDDANR